MRLDHYQNIILINNIFIKNIAIKKQKNCRTRTTNKKDALTNDAEGAHTKEDILQNLYNTVDDKTSVILLMHDAPDKILTYETLPDVIKFFRDKGYEFQTIYDLLDR